MSPNGHLDCGVSCIFLIRVPSRCCLLLARDRLVFRLLSTEANALLECTRNRNFIRLYPTRKAVRHYAGTPVGAALARSLPANLQRNSTAFREIRQVGRFANP